MAYRTITVGNGDTIRISESVLRGAGPEGPLGPAGPPGTATTIRGRFPSLTDLVTVIPIGHQGDGYIADDTGILYTWDVEENNPAWIDCGRIVGPAAVLSVGATRSRTSQYQVRSEITWPVEYHITTNDPDSAGGFVLDPLATQPTKTVVHPHEFMYYIVTTNFTVEESTFERTIMEFSFLNQRDGATSGSTTIVISGEVDFNGQYQAVLRSNNDDEWILQVRSDNDAMVTKLSTSWNRIAGGPGPTGPVGPPPTLEAGRYDKVEHGTDPVWSFVETPQGSGHYVVNGTTVEGPDGNADSGFDMFNDLIPEGDSETHPGGTPTMTWTDQYLPVPLGVAKPSIPWFFRDFCEKLVRRLVSRLDSAEITARGAIEQGELYFDTGENRIIIGQMVPGGAVQRYIVPSIEYGTLPLLHNMATDRPDGSLYFKHDP